MHYTGLVLYCRGLAVYRRGLVVPKTGLVLHGRGVDCSKGALTPHWNDVRTYVRTYVRTSRWKILFTQYLVVDLSPSAEIWCVYVESINDGTQILTFLEFTTIAIFRILDFSVGI